MYYWYPALVLNPGSFFVLQQKWATYRSMWSLFQLGRGLHTCSCLSSLCVPEDWYGETHPENIIVLTTHKKVQVHGGGLEVIKNLASHAWAVEQETMSTIGFQNCMYPIKKPFIMLNDRIHSETFACCGTILNRLFISKCVCACIHTFKCVY